MIIAGKRKQGFEVWRRRGVRPPYYYLMFLVNSRTIPIYFDSEKVSAPRCWHRWRGWWHVPLEHGGKLAVTGPQKEECYPVSYRELPPNVQAKVRRAIRYTEIHGTAFENDEHIYS